MARGIEERERVVDWKKLRRLARFLAKLDLAEVEVEEEGVRMRLRRRESRPGEALAPASPAKTAEPELSPVSASSGSPTAEAGIVDFRSPMVGTFYRAASPEAEPFVQRGSRVEPETVLCIIEAMKVMNEIRAETSGEVVDILVENGEPVEFGQPLLRIRSR